MKKYIERLILARPKLKTIDYCLVYGKYTIQGNRMFYGNDPDFLRFCQRLRDLHFKLCIRMAQQDPLRWTYPLSEMTLKKCYHKPDKYQKHEGQLGPMTSMGEKIGNDSRYPYSNKPIPSLKIKIY
jgi:hypothetical protein